MDFTFIKEKFPHFEMQIDTEYSVYIVNNNGGDNIFIYYEPSIDEYTFCFSYQHIHCEKEELLIWIDEFTNGRVCAIEFFDGECTCGGGNFYTDFFDDLTYKNLKKRYSFMKNTFKIRCWKPEHNFDGKIIKNGLKHEILLEKIKNPPT